MKRFIHRYGILLLSLTVLFASGIAAGYRWGAVSGPAGPAGMPQAVAAVEPTPEQWSENAAAALQKDLGLSEAQTDLVRQVMAGPGREIFEEKHRASLKIHLRLLEVHDTLASSVELTPGQKATLQRRREQLRKLIMEKFRDLLGGQSGVTLPPL